MSHSLSPLLWCSDAGGPAIEKKALRLKRQERQAKPAEMEITAEEGAMQTAISQINSEKINKHKNPWNSCEHPEKM